MSKLFYFSVLLSLLVACGSKSGKLDSTLSSDSTVTDTVTQNVMDSTASDSVSTIDNDVPKQPNSTSINNNKLYSVSGTVYVSQHYCSGARPPDAIREEAEKYKPRAGVNVAFRLGKSNSYSSIIASAVTNSSGQYTVQLPAGTYCMIVDEQTGSRDAYKSGSGTIAENSPACFSKWWDACQSVITVTDKNLVNQNLSLQQNCMVTSLCPCVSNKSSRMLP